VALLECHLNKINNQFYKKCPATLKVDPARHALQNVSVADPIPGSGIRCLFDPESGIWNRFFPDPGSRVLVPKPIFLVALGQFFGEKVI
jgi:hypothetical protein